MLMSKQKFSGWDVWGARNFNARDTSAESMALPNKVAATSTLLASGSL